MKTVLGSATPALFLPWEVAMPVMKIPSTSYSPGPEKILRYSFTASVKLWPGASWLAVTTSAFRRGNVKPMLLS